MTILKSRLDRLERATRIGGPCACGVGNDVLQVIRRAQCPVHGQFTNYDAMVMALLNRDARQ